MDEFAKQSTQELNEQKLLAAQLRIQNSLDDDLSLASVARSVGASPSHFHRLFKARLGETLKTYTDRLRVEKISLRFNYIGSQFVTNLSALWIQKPGNLLAGL